MRSVALTVLAMLAGSAGSASAQVLYSADFESPAFSPGALRSQNGWGAISWIGGIDTDQIATGVSASGTQAIRQDASVLTAPQTGGVGRNQNYWPLLNGRPVIRVAWSSLVPEGQTGDALFGMAAIATAGSPPWTGTGVVAVGTEGSLWRSDRLGNGEKVGVTVPVGSWNHIEMYIDYESRVLTVVVNGRVQSLRSPFMEMADDFFRGIALLTATEMPSTAFAYTDDVEIEALIHGPCYANCDGSSTAPILNIDDFTCFINTFAHGQTVLAAQQL
jgi:hypothetical protein